MNEWRGRPNEAHLGRGLIDVDVVQVHGVTTVCDFFFFQGRRGGRTRVVLAEASGRRRVKYPLQVEALASGPVRRVHMVNRRGACGRL